MATPAVSRVKGTGYRQLSTPTLSPEQMQLFQQLLGGSREGLGAGLGHLGQLAVGSPEAFESLEQPAFRDFSKLLGGISSRFSGIGTGARHSSGFQNTVGGAAGDLAAQLQSQRLSLQQNAISQLLGLSGALLGTPLSERAFLPKQKPFWQELLGAGAAGLGQAAGMLPLLAL